MHSSVYSVLYSQECKVTCRFVPRKNRKPGSRMNGTSDSWVRGGEAGKKKKTRQATDGTPRHKGTALAFAVLYKVGCARNLQRKPRRCYAPGKWQVAGPANAAEKAAAAAAAAPPVALVPVRTLILGKMLGTYTTYKEAG